MAEPTTAEAATRRGRAEALFRKLIDAGFQVELHHGSSSDNDWKVVVKERGGFLSQDDLATLADLADGWQVSLGYEELIFA